MKQGSPASASFPHQRQTAIIIPQLFFPNFSFYSDTRTAAEYYPLYNYYQV
jgi:hypothetical protein